MFRNTLRIVATLLVLVTLTTGAVPASAAEGRSLEGVELSFWGWLSSWLEDAGLITPWEGSSMDPDGRPQSGNPDEGSGMDPDGIIVDEGSSMNPNG